MKYELNNVTIIAGESKPDKDNLMLLLASSFCREQDTLYLASGDILDSTSIQSNIKLICFSRVGLIRDLTTLHDYVEWALFKKDESQTPPSILITCQTRDADFIYQACKPAPITLITLGVGVVKIKV